MAVQYNSDKGLEGWLVNIASGFRGASEAAVKFFKNFRDDELTRLVPELLKKGTFDEFVEGNKLADESLIAFLKDTDRGTKDLASYKQYLKDTGKQTTLFSDLTKKAGNIVKSFAATLGSMAVTKYTYSFYQMIYHPTF